MKGLSFEIPNMQGKYLLDILEETNLKDMNWWIGGGESYKIQNNTLGDSLFSEEWEMDKIGGEKLHKLISQQEYYLIFCDLKGFPKNSDAKEVSTYEEFLESDCQFVLNLVDSSYTTIYSKNQMTIENLYTKAIILGYENVSYLEDEIDGNTTLIAF
ncbi:DUF2691 family protein [Marinilactibacillus sp. Marseille-P9653]|uniref:DUF2691 family protein n=1 Tax=Marinilactibacillus sp. Marseille-P9653 TaxID=2866583 RepID=UPI001CE4966E|nr:DUF2691 family protein [Marinilactibacillus sp. Marseille-P9653]